MQKPDHQDADPLLRPEDASLRMAISYWGMVGALVNSGLLHAGLLLKTTGQDP